MGKGLVGVSSVSEINYSGFLLIAYLICQRKFCN